MAPTVKGRIERNAIILVFTEVLVKVSAMVVAIAAGRMLGVANFGLLGYAYAVAAVCVVVPDFGFDRLAVRELARRPSRASRFLVNISAVKATLYLPAAAACALVAWFNSEAIGRLLVVMVVFLFAATENHMLFTCSFFRAMQKMEHEGLVRLILALLLLSTGLAVLLAGFGLKTLVLSRLATSAFCLALSILLLTKTLGVTFAKLSWRYSKTLVKMSAPISIYVILSKFFNSINVVILSFLKGDLSTGYYVAAFKIVSLFFIVSTGLSGATMPALSKYFKDAPEKFVRSFQRSVRYLLLLSIPLCVGTFFLGEKAIILIFGADYLASVGVIKVLALLLLPSFLNDIVSVTLISMHKERVIVAGSMVGSVALPVFCFILIPHWGAVGAAIGLVIANTVLFFFRFPTLFHEFGVFSQLITVGRALLAAGLMAVGLLLFLWIGMPLPLLVGLSIFVYMSTLLAVGEVKLHEAKSVGEVLRDNIRSLFQSPRVSQEWDVDKRS